MNLKAYIRETPDFPKQGVLFRDFTPLLSDSKILNYIAINLIKDIELSQVDYFGGIESRGFILATLMASIHNKGFIPIRKSGKLPPPVLQEHYQLEYGAASLEMHSGKGNIVIVDDVLATGGTLQAAINICQKAGYNVTDVRTLINLKFLNSFTFNKQKPFSLIEYEA